MLKSSEVSSLFPQGHRGRRKEGNRGLTFRVAVRGDTARLREVLGEGLENGDDDIVDQRNPVNGRTVLHEACAHGHIDMAKMLLKEFNADVGKTTFMGKTTALHIAAAAGHRKICFYLLVSGADVHAKDKYGATPLHNVKQLDVAKLLVQYGALCSVRANNGKSPVVVVLGLEGDHSKLVHFLEKAGEEQERAEFEAELEKLKEEKLHRKLLEEQRKKAILEENRLAILNQAEKEYNNWKQARPPTPPPPPEVAIKVTMHTSHHGRGTTRHGTAHHELLLTVYNGNGEEQPAVLLCSKPLEKNQKYVLLSKVKEVEAVSKIVLSVKKKHNQPFRVDFPIEVGISGRKYRSLEYEGAAAIYPDTAGVEIEMEEC